MSKNLTDQKIDKEKGQHDKMSKNLTDQKIEKEKKEGKEPDCWRCFLSLFLCFGGENQRNFRGDFGRKFEEKNKNSRFFYQRRSLKPLIYIHQSFSMAHNRLYWGYPVLRQQEFLVIRDISHFLRLSKFKNINWAIAGFE